MRLGRVFALGLAVLGMVGLAATGVLLAVILSGGFVTVDVTTESATGRTRIFLPVPAALVDGTLAAVSLLNPGVGNDLLPAEAADWEPCLRELASALEKAPSATFVEVVDREEVVRIAKRGRRLIVEVDSPEARVRVRVPVRLLRRTVERLAA